jgi:L-lactate utilization protein LutB
MGVTKKESASTRFKAVLAKRGETSPLFYLSSDMGLQEQVCPSAIDLTGAFRAARERNVKAGVTTQANEAMLANFRKNGTPYDSLTAEDFHDKPVW